MIRPSASMLQSMIQTQIAQEIALAEARRLEVAGFTNIPGTDEWVAPETYSSYDLLAALSQESQT